MPKKRRQSHIPQQPARKRRARRRQDSAAEAQPEEQRTDSDGQPIFADEPALPAATAHYGSTGPVETRSHWIGGTSEQRTPGRRTARLRSGASEAAARVTLGQLPTFERAYITDELRRIAIISGSLFALLIVLALVMR